MNDTFKNRETTSIIIGLLLVLGGALFLLGNFGLFENVGALIWALIFAAGGAAFLAVFVTNTNRNWWALFPAFALLGIGVLIGMDTLLPWIPEQFGGGLFLGALSLSFWGVYATHQEHWWAIIPGGVLLTLAGVATISNTFAGGIRGAFLPGPGCDVWPGVSAAYAARPHDLGDLAGGRLPGARPDHAPGGQQRLQLHLAAGADPRRAVHGVQDDGAAKRGVGTGRLVSCQIGKSGYEGTRYA